jgi:hypothetical protein
MKNCHRPPVTQVATHTGCHLRVPGVTSALVATTPARVAYRRVQERTVDAGPVSVRLTATPAAARAVSVHAHAFGKDRLPVDVINVTTSTEPRHGGVGPITWPLSRAGTVRFVADQILLPTAGVGIIKLVVRTSELDACSAMTTMQVR